MLTVRCEMTVIDVDGDEGPEPRKDDPRRVVVTSYETRGCGEGEYVTIHLPEGASSATVRAGDLIRAARAASDPDIAPGF